MKVNKVELKLMDVVDQFAHLYKYNLKVIGIARLLRPLLQGSSLDIRNVNQTLNTLVAFVQKVKKRLLIIDGSPSKRTVL